MLLRLLLLTLLLRVLLLLRLVVVGTSLSGGSAEIFAGKALGSASGGKLLVDIPPIRLLPGLLWVAVRLELRFGCKAIEPGFCNIVGDFVPDVEGNLGVTVPGMVKVLPDCGKGVVDNEKFDEDCEVVELPKFGGI